MEWRIGIHKPYKRKTSVGYPVNFENGKAIFIHRVIAEKALGKELPPKATLHHVNGNKLDNKNCNLVICQDRAYHNLLHRRTTALREVGNPNFRKCCFCKKWDSPENMYVNEIKRFVWHRHCYNRSRHKKFIAQVA